MSKSKQWGIRVLWVVVGLAALGGVLWGPIVSNVEQAKYTVAEKYGDIEIRDYAPMIVAEAETKGDQREAIQSGFRIIADYIFGNNLAAQKVAMTAPVTQQSSEKIAMTAPVTQQGDGNTWKVRFVMPSSYRLETLPKPKNEGVKLKKVAAKRFAVIRFSGIGKGDNLDKHTEILQAFVKERKLKTLSAPTYAFFNPPWTLPFLRRNEVMVEIAK